VGHAPGNEHPRARPFFSSRTTRQLRLPPLR
jgi:hypothetical protein